MRNLVLLLLLLTAAAHADERLRVYTVNYPLQYLTQRIAGDRAEVVFPGPADQDPALWTPPRDILEAYRNADLILLNGAGYAKWLDKFSLPSARTVNTSQAFREQYIGSEDPQTGTHEPGADHAAPVSATWLDFYQASQQAESILGALSEKRPIYKAEFEKRYEKLREELLQLDLDVQKLLAKQPGKPLFVSQPVYQYFARRYQVHLESLRWEPDRVPEDSEWQTLAYAQEAFPAQWMLWARQPVADTSDRLHMLGINVVIFDPCANRPLQGDFMSVMRDNINNLEKVFP